MNTIQPSSSRTSAETTPPPSTDYCERISGLAGIVAASAIAYFVSGWIACAAVAVAGIAIFAMCRLFCCLNKTAQTVAPIASGAGELALRTLEMGIRRSF